MAYEVSIFLENKIGHFERITHILKENNINIRSMALNNTSNGWGILDLLVNSPEKAYNALADKGVSVALREIIALEMKDVTGGLDDLLLKVSKANVNFDNAYGRIIQENKAAILVIDVQDVEDSKKKLQEAGIQMLDDKNVYGIE
ncbi:MAG: hypothetical protein PHS40_02815 [Mariniphaga sp.]|nr:hypothetical protein [Mariniphaga sp.]MDD4226874.1 hypothetical protein [Mariniphaga sp.]MDD4424836.1 hypothetical protein [Mariniphaga sp.]